MLEFRLTLVLCLIGFGCMDDGDQLLNDHRSKRVISSKYATPHSRPWNVLLIKDGYSVCGATLINRPPYHMESLDEGSSDLLLTAAHCVIEKSGGKVLLHSMDPKRFTALFGKHNSTGYESDQIEVPVINIIVHPLIKVHNSRVFNDIAVLKLERPVNFSTMVKPIALSNFSIDEVTNCSIAGWGRYKEIPPNLDPNSVLSVLDLPNLDQFVDSFLMGIEHWNNSIKQGDSGSPATCWKDGRVFIQGILALMRVKEGITNFGDHNINITVPEDIQFTDVNAMNGWIGETFQRVNTPTIWHRNLFEYGHNLMKQPAYSSILMDEELLNEHYGDTQLPHNHELITPQWSRADYLRLWFDNKVHDHLSNDTKFGKFHIKYVIGYTKRSDPYKCAVDCFQMNGNRPCLFAFTISRCFFSSVESIISDYKSPLEGLAIYFQGAKKDVEAAMSINFKLPKSIANQWKVSVILEKHKNIHCFGTLISHIRVSFDWVKVSRKCYTELRKHSEVSAGRFFMESGSIWSEYGWIRSVHTHPSYSDSNSTLDNIAIIELVYPIYFDRRINPAIFIYSADSLENGTLLALTYDVACNYDIRKPLNRVPVRINPVADDASARDIVAERLFYIQNKDSCSQQTNSDGEPLFAYDNASREYKLVGLLDRVISQNAKFVESYKSIQYYTHWIEETVEKLMTARKEKVKIRQEALEDRKKIDKPILKNFFVPRNNQKK